jgi:hypothetical protein
MSTSKVKRLPPDTFVEVADIVNNGRKIAIVDVTGLGYFDLLGHDEDAELPKPLFHELQVVELGTIPAWLRECEPGAADEYRQVWQKMLDAGHDALTVARAIRWGIVNGSTDHELLVQMGKEATERVARGRDLIVRGLSA